MRSLFSFSFVRNPWDRAVSSYSNPDPHLIAQAQGLGLDVKQMDFKEFVNMMTNVAHSHFLPQHQFVLDPTGNPLVDFLGRYENLEEDFRRVCEEIGVRALLPHANASQRSDYRRYYDSETAAQINAFYRDDIELFGYRF